MKLEFEHKVFKNNDYECCLISKPFRIFYNLNGDDKTPKNIEYKTNDLIPEYILQILKSFSVAYELYIKKLKLLNPLEKGIYFEKSAKFIDILIVDIPVQKGLVSSELIDNSFYFNDEILKGKSIKILLDRNLITNTATPIHELFHVFQYNYSNFNNMWFMEGLARWAQNLTHKREKKFEKLPSTFEELEELLIKAHDAEYFFRELISKVENQAEFLKILLENSSIAMQKMQKKYQNLMWTKEDKKSSLNNIYLLEAIVNSIEILQKSPKDDLFVFLNICKKYIKKNENIKKSKTISITSPLQLERYEEIEEIEGDLIIENLEINSLNGFNNLKKVNTIIIKNNSNLHTINGFNSLNQMKNLEISRNDSLENIYGFFKFFTKVSKIDGYIKIEHNKKLENIRFLKGISYVGSSFYLHHNNLKSLNGLEDLIEVNASLSLSSNQIKDLEPLYNLKKVNGMLGLAYNLLISLRGIDNLVEISVTKWGNEYRSIAIQRNKNLKDISSLQNIISNTNHCIINLDLQNQDFITPSKNSNFYNQSLKLINNGQNISVNSVFTNYEESKKIKILFYNSWQKALSKHSWLDAHFFNFSDVNSLIHYAKKHGIIYIYGQIYTAQKFLYENKERLKEEGFKFTVNDLDIVRLLLNKKKFYEYMIKHNLDCFIPKYYPTIEDVKYPCVIKHVSAANGDSVRICHSIDDLREIKEDEVVNEYIEGKTEYASNIFYRKGQIIEDASYEKTFNNEYYVLNQDTKYKMINRRIENKFKDDFISIFKTLLPNDGELLCCIDYKIEDNIPKIFEINVRLGYTLAMYSEDFEIMMNKYMIECDYE